MGGNEGFFLCCTVFEVEGLRKDPLTLENEVVCENDSFRWCSGLESEAELAMEFSRFFARRSRRSPTFSVL